MTQLNFLQMQVLRELLFKPNSRFTDLLKLADISSDHLAYHLRVLTVAGLVYKKAEKYLLSVKGKEFANTMDTEKLQIEKQPKLAVVIFVHKKVSGKEYYLVQHRLKEPYFGYYGFMSGKIRFGETVLETAQRELLEESGLRAKTFRHIYVLHEMVYNKQNELLEDKFFNLIEATGISGKIINRQGGDNQWYTEAEFYKLTPKFHNEQEIFQWCKTNDQGFKEEKYYIESF